MIMRATCGAVIFAISVGAQADICRTYDPDGDRVLEVYLAPGRI